ncbi:MAG: hypothetical protein N4A43_02460 [Alphaproteobacteria bacterium]|jgi:hypothetical protein|nr:hypothetical protein [Alphaproteobacteria bacterium]
MAIINLSLKREDKNNLISLEEKNVRFITAKSLTRTAQNIQREVQGHIRKDFVLRKRSFERSIRILPATKQRLESKVYTMAPFASLQQTGGIKKASSGRLAIPLYKDISRLKSRTATNRPRGLKDSFILKLESGSLAIAVRKSKQIKVMYYLKQRAYVKKRLNMLEIGEQVAVKNFSLHFQKSLREIN